jgi:hypothetical protein
LPIVDWWLASESRSGEIGAFQVYGCCFVSDAFETFEIPSPAIRMRKCVGEVDSCDEVEREEAADAKDN